jgi:hypothetical protein
MADETAKESVFRFIAVRPADGGKVTGGSKVLIGASHTRTVLLSALKAAADQGQDQTVIARSYLAQHPDPVPQSSARAAGALDAWARRNATVTLSRLRPDELRSPELDAQVLRSLSDDASDYLAASVAAGESTDTDVTSIIKAAEAALLTLNGDTSTHAGVTLQNYLSACTVILPDYVNAPKGAANARRPKAASASAAGREEKLTRLEALETAHRELTRLGSDEKYRYQPRREAAPPVEMPDPPKGAEGQVIFNQASPSLYDRDFIVDQKFVEQVSPGTLALLEEYGVTKDRVSPQRLLPVLEESITQARAEMEQSFGAVAGKVLLSAPLARCMYQAGVGDLLLVRQKLKAYQLIEIAHVENVLAGESKERVHRSLSIREEVTTTRTESDTERERDLQSTERNELQTEAENTVKEDFRFDAGLQVSGSYGPSVSFSANASTSFARSVEDVQRRAATFSREITERATEKVREKVTAERVVRLRQESEETNTHQVDNRDTEGGHMRGVYRWLNRIYDAQIYNYGRRMMYEFIVPEPAAFYIYAKLSRPNPNDDLRKPEPPRGPDGPLRPTDLTEYAYGRYLAEYQVTNAPAPPARRIVKSFTDKQEGEALTNYARANTVSIPDGYVAEGARITYFYQGRTPDPTGMSVTIGVGGVERRFRFMPPSSYSADPPGYFLLPGGYERELSVLVSTHNIQSFAIGVDVFCALTAQGSARWQLAAYEAIIQAYQNQLAVYEDRVRAREVRDAGFVQGQNPLLNRRIERDELKKLCVMMLRNDAALNFDAYLDADEAEPTIELDEACEQGSIIRFLENALEWNNMMYVLYPYFWGRHSRWVPALHINDPDPDFEAFLKAGAARVQVPVRPGFERAMAYFCQNGTPWLGGDPPVRGGDMYLPIIQEVTESLGRPGDERPYPEGSEPWEVVLPTSLVVLQNLEEVPNIRDVMTGRNIGLLPR